VVLILLFFLALLCVLLWVLRGQVRSRGQHKKDHSVIKKILISHLQQVALLLSFNLEWPNPLKLTLELSNSASSAAGDVASPDCLRQTEVANSVSSAFRLRVVGTLLLPVVFICIAIIVLSIYMRYTQPLARVCSTAYYRVWFLAVSIVSFMLYSPVTRTALQLFACRRIAGQSRLAQDLSVHCDSVENSVWRLGVGLPVLLLFSIGFPAALGVSLFLRRDSLSEEGTRRLLGFFYLGYKLEFYWYEVLVLVRKSAFALVLVALGSAGTLWQGSCGIVVLVCNLVVTTWLQPFKKPMFNVLDAASMCLSVLTLAGGVCLVQFDPLLKGAFAEIAGGPTAQRGVTILLTITNVIFVLALLLWWGREWYLAEAASKVGRGVQSLKRVGSTLSKHARKSRQATMVDVLAAAQADFGHDEKLTPAGSTHGQQPTVVHNPLRSGAASTSPIHRPQATQLRIPPLTMGATANIGALRQKVVPLRVRARKRPAI
jgi:hypothetical protein